MNKTTIFLQEFTKQLINNSISKQEKEKIILERERLIQEAIQKERQVFVEMPKQSLSSFEKNQENKVAVQEESRPFIFNTRPVSSMEQVQTNSYVSFDNGEGN